MGKSIPATENDVELGEEKFEIGVYCVSMSLPNVDGNSRTIPFAGSILCKSNDVGGALGRARMSQGELNRMRCRTERICIVMIGRGGY